MQTRDEVVGFHNEKAVERSPNPSIVYIRPCKYKEKVFYCFYKLTFPRKKNAKLFVMALIKTEIHSH